MQEKNSAMIADTRRRVSLRGLTIGGYSLGERKNIPRVIANPKGVWQSTGDIPIKLYV